MGWIPRSRAASALSTTRAAAPMPIIMPWRRRSKGTAASSTTSSVAAAPLARKPAPIHSIRWSEVTSSAEMTITRLHRPAWIQSSASATACVVLAQAELICVLGPRAPMNSANCECPMDKTRNRNRRSKTYGSFSMAARNLVDAPVDLLHQNGMAIRLYLTGEQAFQHSQLLAAGVVRVVARHLIGERVQPGEGGGKNHAGIVAQSVGQSPAIGQLRAFARGLVAHDQRDAGVAQCVDARGDRQLSDTVEGGHAFAGNAEFIFQIERAAAACQLDDVCDTVDGLERGLAVLALHQARDVFVEHGAAEARGDRIDELIAAQNAADVGIIEDVLGSGQA